MSKNDEAVIMSGYTLKLDLTDYERNALVTALRTEAERRERDGMTETPFYAAMVGILDDIDGYESSVANLRRQAREARYAALHRLVEAASQWEDTVGSHRGAHIDAGDDMRNAVRELTD